MNIQPLKIFSRSAVFELDNTSCYFSDTTYDLYLNDKRIIESGKKNVFSVYNLMPKSSYRLTLKGKDAETALRFETLAESYLLDVTRFGAVPDGKTDCTASLQAAIACCPAGGTVCLPAGIYTSGPLFLKSDMTLLLEKGSVLLGISNRSQYPVLPGVTLAADEQNEYYLGTWEGNPLSCYAGLLNGINLQNVSITGEGTIDANAQNGDWWENPKQKKVAWNPRTLFLNSCKNVTVHGISFQNSYSWTLHPYFCVDFHCLDVSICNPPDSPNTDGIDPESCENVRIIGTHISVGDDCISIKSGKLFMAIKRQTPCRSITIRNCFMENGHGGVAIGSEVAAGVYQVHISQCYMYSTDRGLRIKTRRGRGRLSVLDDILFENIRMEHVLTPLAVSMFYYCDPDGHSHYVYAKEPLPVDDRTPSIKKLVCRNIHCTDCSVAGVYLYGLPEMPIEDIVLENIFLTFSPNAESGFAAMMDHVEKQCRKGVFARNVHLLQLNKITVIGNDGAEMDLDGITELKKGI
ncbi:MAG TPA: glycoside hydrolase family 28 protein [Oscillospiraceae bacterium]|nr:glycoside hydrolase family 28 protein [Oscillospiraceae bacterium]